MTARRSMTGFAEIVYLAAAIAGVREPDLATLAHLSVVVRDADVRPDSWLQFVVEALTQEPRYVRRANRASGFCRVLIDYHGSPVDW